MIYESHAHYDDTKFDEDRDNLLESLKENNIDFVINVGTNIESSKNSIDLANKYDYIFASVGFHPHDTEDMKDEDLDTIFNLAKEKKVVAIGEIGLDYYYEFSNREVQKKRFIQQLEIAKELNLPVIIHSRDASQDTFNIIKNANLSLRDGKGAGVIHCYSGELELAKEYIKLGFYIGVGGVVTFSNAKKLVRVVENISLENILLETDSPYLAPVPQRGKRNTSLNLKYIGEKIAQIKNTSVEDVYRVTKENCINLFK